jgi:hypothetical protein
VLEFFVIEHETLVFSLAAGERSLSLLRVASGRDEVQSIVQSRVQAVVEGPGYALATPRICNFRITAAKSGSTG